jgi:hypothetical protein
VTRKEIEQVRTIIKDVLAASNELMTEFVSHKRAANWGIVNDGLYNAEQFLRNTERRKA